MNQQDPTDQSIADVASQILDIQARNDYLQKACQGDLQRLARINDMISHGDATRQFSAPAFPSQPPTASLDTHASNQSGELIAGKYKLVRPVGEGGMGTVWIAEQREPVRRTVALKLIKKGMDSRAVLARFEAERQALALMDHPNIAKILDAGITTSGSPFFVMELVKGVPITEFCDSRRYTPQQRLELFIPVCNAIQHAHHKGIIHRDIKPSNVLVALIDDKPVPKVIDFGVAKATGQALTDITFNTGLGVVGTPQYMSPEQASFNQMDIDTRSDVYSLGVLLYELLAGSPPFAQKELAKAGYLEILRVIREEDPPRPSTKLSTAEGLPSLSACRNTEPKRLSLLLRNELDWIVMRALEKDRARRYETANAFAADINRYLTGEPVRAHPPSGSYRLRKFLSKNRGPVIAACFIAGALLVGIIGTTLGLLEARRQTRVALGESKAKERALQKEALQRKWAEQRLVSLRSTISTVVNDIPNYLSKVPYGETIQTSILSKMEGLLKTSDSAWAEDTSADSSRAWGLLAVELKAGDQAARQGDSGFAIGHYMTARTIAQGVLNGKPRDRAKAQNNLARVLNALAKTIATRGEGNPLSMTRDAIALCEQALKEPLAEESLAHRRVALGLSWRTLADVQHELLKKLPVTQQVAAATEAMNSLQKAMELMSEALDEIPDDAQNKSNRDNAIRYLAQAAQLQATLGTLAQDQRAVEAGHITATRHFLDLVERNRDQVRDRVAAAESFANYGDYLLITKHDPVAARIQYVENMKQLRSLGDDTSVKELATSHAMAYYRLGLAANAQGNLEQVRRYFERACLITDIRLREALDNPAARQDPDSLMDDQNLLMLEQAWAGQYEAALTKARSVVNRYKDLDSARKSKLAATHLAQAAFAMAITARFNPLDEPEKDAVLAEALTILKKAVAIGYNDVNYLETDPDAEPLRRVEGFQEIISKLKTSNSP